MQLSHHALEVAAVALLRALRRVPDERIGERLDREMLLDDRGPARRVRGQRAHDLVAHVAEGALRLERDGAVLLVPELDELVVRQPVLRLDAGDEIEAGRALARRRDVRRVAESARTRRPGTTPATLRAARAALRRAARVGLVHPVADTGRLRRIHAPDAHLRAGRDVAVHDVDAQAPRTGARELRRVREQRVAEGVVGDALRLPEHRADLLHDHPRRQRMQATSQRSTRVR